MGRTANGIAERQWRDRLRRWRASGLSVLRFCEFEGVSAPSFYQWRKRLERDQESGRCGQSPVFVPLQVVDTPAAAPSGVARAQRECGLPHSDVEVELACGVTIRVGAHVDESRLRSVLRAVIAESGQC